MSAENPLRCQCFWPPSVVHCAHVDGDLVQAWRSGSAYVIEGPYGRVGLGLPVYAYTAEDCAIEFARRAERLHAPESGAAG